MSRKAVLKVLPYAAMIGLTVLVIELLSAVATGVLVRRGWMATIGEAPSDAVATYLAERNPELGWGPSLTPTGRVKELSPRPDPLLSTGAACASTYGDSFTWGDEAGDLEAYPHQLARTLGCPVANYGVPGYGSDQAFMLFRRQAHLDESKAVIMGHLSENILRNVNRHRGLLYPGNSLSFKPRYERAPTGLAYLPPPVASMEDWQRLHDDPERVLAPDYFLHRPRRGFPHALALARWIAEDFHVQAELRRIPRHMPFYSAAHDSQALQLTISILTRFAEEAELEGRNPYILLIPTGTDLVFAAENGRFPDQPLADSLTGRGLAVIHAAPHLLQAGTIQPCALYHRCSGHFNARGYLRLAEIVGKRVIASQHSFESPEVNRR